ncbi:uncharacterized protein LOC128210990 [Mya arenaria]|uniref:uncharacterized protein LOC128210990 n=1 Tax=Mya arenaria TaxID=6604 RepID=UPI0022E68CDF|nr:uncharacterized protein LOC128210990 [Mya arenaria]
MEVNSLFHYLEKIVTDMLANPGSTKCLYAEDGSRFFKFASLIFEDMDVKDPQSLYLREALRGFRKSYGSRSADVCLYYVFQFIKVAQHLQPQGVPFALTTNEMKATLEQCKKHLVSHVSSTFNILQTGDLPCFDTDKPHDTELPHVLDINLTHWEARDSYTAATSESYHRDQIDAIACGRKYVTEKVQKSIDLNNFHGRKSDVVSEKQDCKSSGCAVDVVKCVPGTRNKEITEDKTCINGKGNLTDMAKQKEVIGLGKETTDNGDRDEVIHLEMRNLKQDLIEDDVSWFFSTEDRSLMKVKNEVVSSNLHENKRIAVEIEIENNTESNEKQMVEVEGKAIEYALTISRKANDKETTEVKSEEIEDDLIRELEQLQKDIANDLEQVALLQNHTAAKQVKRSNDSIDEVSVINTSSDSDFEDCFDDFERTTKTNKDYNEMKLKKKTQESLFKFDTFDIELGENLDQEFKEVVFVMDTSAEMKRAESFVDDEEQDNNQENSGHTTSTAKSQELLGSRQLHNTDPKEFSLPLNSLAKSQSKLDSLNLQDVQMMLKCVNDKQSTFAAKMAVLSRHLNVNNDVNSENKSEVVTDPSNRSINNGDGKLNKDSNTDTTSPVNIEVKHINRTKKELIEDGKDQLDQQTRQQETDVNKKLDPSNKKSFYKKHADITIQKDKSKNRNEILKLVKGTVGDNDSEIADVVTDIIMFQNDGKAEGKKFILDPAVVQCYCQPGGKRRPVLVPGLVISTLSNQLGTILRNGQSTSYRTLLLNADLARDFRHKGYKSMKGTQLISAENYASTVDEKSTWKQSIFTVLNQLKVNLILVKGTASEWIRTELESNGVVVLDQMGYRALELVSMATQTDMLTYVLLANEDMVSEGISLSSWQPDWMDHLKCHNEVVLTVHKSPLQTVVISEIHPALCDLREQEFWDCLYQLTSVLTFDDIVVGQGQIEKYCIDVIEKKIGVLHSASDVSYRPPILETFQRALQHYIQHVSPYHGYIESSTMKMKILTRALDIASVVVNIDCFIQTGRTDNDNVDSL